MLDHSGSPAHWLGEIYQGKKLREPINVVNSWGNMLTYVSVLILVGTEVYGVAFATAWALGGF